MSQKNVNLIRPGKTYLGAQDVTYSAGVSRNTVGSEKVCIYILHTSHVPSVGRVS